MPRRSRWPTVVLLIPTALTAFLLACSGKQLERPLALDLLRAHEEASVERELFFILGAPLYLGGQEGELYKSLEKAGWLRIEKPRNVAIMQGWRPAELLGQKILRLGRCGAQPQCAFVPVGKRTVEEVTGIVQKEGEALVQFTWKWALTPVGEELASAGVNFPGLHDVYGPFDPNQAITAEAAFTLFDDGWRVHEVEW